MYHENPAINDTVLTIINDGNGEMCGGMDYERRKDAGRTSNVLAFRSACRAYSRYRHKHFESRHLTLAEVREAADLLLDYYVEHVKECEQ